MPTQFEVLLVRDIAGRFSGSRTFIEHLEDAVPYFYEQVGQHLRAYAAPPPRLRKEEGDKEKAEGSLEEVADEAEAAASEATDKAQAVVPSVAEDQSRSADDEGKTRHRWARVG